MSSHRPSRALLAATSTLVACYTTAGPAPAPTTAVQTPASEPMVGAAPVEATSVRAAPAPGGAPAISPGVAALLMAIQPPTPEPMAPPPVHQAVMIPLPDLPHPSKYPRPPTHLAERDVTGCGVTWTGSDWVQMECVDPGVITGQARSARVVIPYTMMPLPAAAIPPIVDHRLDGTEGPVRHQGGPQCTAFSLTAALDHAYARWTGKPGSFSVMQVWGRYHKSSEDQAADGNVGATVGVESDWPYDSPLASSWKACHGRTDGVPCGQEPDPARMRLLEASAVAEVTQIEVIPKMRFDIVREKIAGGQDVVAGINIHSFATAGAPGARYVIGDERNKGIHGSHQHQILLSGYAMTPNGNYYLMHNSTGPKWGDDGYAWLHEDVLRAYSLNTDLVVPEVQPRQVAELRVRPDGGLIAKCAAGTVPDSISGQCAGICPDGSPRHNNVCANATSQCPAGTVNLTGACLMAAPKSRGVDPASRIRWSCGPGGCTYDIPGGLLLCKDAVCNVSCPAPAFRLATTPRGIACVQ